MNDRIEIATEKDAERIRELMELSVQRLPSRDWFVDDDIPFILRHLSAEGYILKYTACQAGENPQQERIAGYIMLRKPGLAQDNLGQHLNLPPEEYPAVTHIESTSVDPAFRGQGIFRKLLDAAIEKEKAEGTTRYLMATVHPDNIYSKNVLQAAGFTPIMTTQKYGGLTRTILSLQI